MKLISIVSCAFFAVLSASLAFSADKPILFVSIIPQKYFVQQISGDTFRVEVMVKPGASPATYEPKPSQMKMLAESDIYFAIGVPFENSWLPKIAGINKQMQIVRTDEGIEKIKMETTSDGEHEAGHDHGHEHGGYDPHIWLSPTLVKQQVAIIASSLEKQYPQYRLLFSENKKKFLKSVDQLNEEMHSILDNSNGLEFMVFHPSWGYFARDFGLEQVPIEVEGKSPKSSQLRELVEHARKHGIKIIFAQPQFSRKSAEVIAREIDGEVLFIDPLAEDWQANMLEVATRIKKTMEKR